MGTIRMNFIIRGGRRFLTGVASLAMAAGLVLSVSAADGISVPKSRHAFSSAFPVTPLIRVDTARLMPLSSFGSVLSPADGVGLYAGLNFSVVDIINGYAMGKDVTLPSADFVSGYEGGVSYAGVQMMLADGVRFNFGQAFSDTYRHGRRDGYAALRTVDHDRSERLLSGLSWDFAKWGGVSLTSSETHVRDVALGNAASAMDLARMASLGLSAHVGLGDGWVTSVSYKQASLKLSLNPGISQANPVLHRESFGIAVAKQGLFGRDALGLSLSRPSGDFSNAPHLPQDMQFQFYGRDKLFSNKSAQETDIGLGYVTSFLDGPIALQANASYQLNALGQNKDSLTFMSRAKIKF